MTFNQIKMAIFATYLTNKFGFRLRGSDAQTKRKFRYEYSQILLKKLNLNIKVIHPEKCPKDGQFLLVCNHRSVIDPLIVETALKDSNILGHWIAKKELYNSFFFGQFVRNAGTILIDRESSAMGDFFADIKEKVKQGDSIFIFPEGTRNKTDKPISEFKEGSRIIALKNRLNILPVYIRTQAYEQLKEAIKCGKQEQTIEVEFGDIIDYRDKSLSLEDAYKKQFGIE